MEIKFEKIINIIFFLLTIIILFNYIRQWNKNMKNITNINKINELNYEKFINNQQENNQQENNKQENNNKIKLGYANELETNEYQHLDEEIQKKTDGTKFLSGMTIQENLDFKEFQNNIKLLETSNLTGIELFNEKNRIYQEYLKKQKKIGNEQYLETVNVDPLNDPIKLTDRFPRRREELMDEQLKRHYYKLNKDWEKMGGDVDLFLQKYGWLNEMGKSSTIPINFNLKTSTEDILEYKKENSGRMPQDIITDYNPIIMGSQRLTSEDVTRLINDFYLKPMTELEYNKYLDKILNKDNTKKYYELIGIE